MRYASVNQQGKIVGIFTCNPELLHLRTKLANTEFVECIDANMEDHYHDGNDFVNKQENNITFEQVQNNLYINNLPDDSEINIFGINGLDKHITTGNVGFSLDSGSYSVEIDPWPYTIKRFGIFVE